MQTVLGFGKRAIRTSEHRGSSAATKPRLVSTCVFVVCLCVFVSPVFALDGVTDAPRKVTTPIRTNTNTQFSTTLVWKNVPGPRSSSDLPRNRVTRAHNPLYDGVSSRARVKPPEVRGEKGNRWGKGGQRR
jgi:hypothetical protein